MRVHYMKKIKQQFTLLYQAFCFNSAHFNEVPL